MAHKRPGHGGKRPTPPPATRQDLEELYVALWLAQRSNTKKIMAKLSELAGILGTIDDKLDKVKTEVTAATATLQAAIDQLKADIEAGKDPTIPDEAQVALDRLTAVAESLDELNPDAPATPPADGGGELPPPTTLGARRAAKTGK